MYSLQTKNEAIELRKAGLFYHEITAKTGVLKATLIRWAKHIPKSEELIERLGKGRLHGALSNSMKAEVVRESYRKEAEKLWPVYKQNPLFVFGLALYVGEGAKTSRNSASISNCDSLVLQRAKDFFLFIGVPAQELKSAVYIHKDCDPLASVQYWSEKLSIPTAQFTKTVKCNPTSRKHNARKQEFGTCRIAVHSTKIMQKIDKWMELSLKGIW